MDLEAVETQDLDEAQARIRYKASLIREANALKSAGHVEEGQKMLDMLSSLELARKAAIESRRGGANSGAGIQPAQSRARSFAVNSGAGIQPAVHSRARSFAAFHGIRRLPVARCTGL